MSLALSLLYLGGFVIWSLLLIKYQKVVVDHQKYIAYVLGLSFAEMTAYYVFYRHYNSAGYQCMVCSVYLQLTLM